jgi:hypothetical protein
MPKKAKWNKIFPYIVAFSIIIILLTIFIGSGYLIVEISSESTSPESSPSTEPLLTSEPSPLPKSPSQEESPSPQLSPSSEASPSPEPSLSTEPPTEQPTEQPNAEPTPELHNCVWMLPYRLLPWRGHYAKGLGNELDDPQFIIDRLDGLNIDCVMVHGGNWTSDGTIKYDSGTTFEMWTDFINAMKAWNTNIKVLVWVLGYGNADLSNSSIRDEMYDSARELLGAVPFDGWNEDYEGWKGDVSDAITFYQGMARTVKNIGKIATIAAEVEWGGYGIEDYVNLTTFDYIMPMFYGYVSSLDAEYYWNKILTKSPAPVIMGLAVLLKQNGGTPLAQQLTWIDTQSHPNLAGFSLWAYDYMSNEDFEAWKNWKTKNSILS